MVEKVITQDDGVTFYNVSYAANESGLSSNHLRRLIRDGRVMYKKIRGRYYIPETEVPIDTADLRQKTDFKQEITDRLAEIGQQPEGVSAEEWFALHAYANGQTLNEVAEGIRMTRGDETALSRQRVHQIISDAYEKIR